MKIIYSPQKGRDVLPDNLTLALGNFDGVHIGHKELFKTAKGLSAKCGVWTFASPAKPMAAVPLLCCAEERLRLFSLCGLDCAIIEDFEKVKNLSPEEFVADYLNDTIGASHIVCGENFRFGCGGTGNAEMLLSLCKKSEIGCTVLPLTKSNGKTVSSTEIRSLILNGEIEKANSLLGHRFSVFQKVISGKHLGKSLGFPTLNQDFEKGLIIPPFGVYFTYTEIGGKLYPSVSNIGIRPTVETNATPNIETYILDFSGNLYCEKIRIEFIKFLRPEQNFSTKENLILQIKKDICEAKSFFAHERSR